MADTIYLTLAKTAILEGLLAGMQVGSAAPALIVYNGTRNNVGASTALVTFTLADPAGAIDTGALTLTLATATATSMVTASGVPQWGMLFDGNSQAFVHFDAGGVTSGATVLLSVDDGAPIFAGGLVSLYSAVFGF